MAMINTITEGMNEKWSKLVNIFLATNSVGLIMLTYVTLRVVIENISYELIPIISLFIF